MELFEQIRREYEHGVGTIKGVARKLGVHRRMVREAIGNAIPPARKAPARERPKLGPAEEFIDSILESDRKAPRKQRHTAHRMWVRLRKEDAGDRSGRVHGAALRAPAEARAGAERRRDVCAAELPLGPGSAGGLV